LPPRLRPRGGRARTRAAAAPRLVRVRGRGAGADGPRPRSGHAPRARARGPDPRRHRPLRAERAVRGAGADVVRRARDRARRRPPEPVRRRDRVRPPARRDGGQARRAARVRARRAAGGALRADRALHRPGHGRGDRLGEGRLTDRTEFKLRRAGEVAIVTLDNGEDHTKPTVLGRAGLASLHRLLPELEQGDFRAIVLTGKPFVFCAGADVDEFPQIRTREQAIEGSRAGHDLFGRLRALPYPTVAAINGACLGGGVELALHCTARTISTAVRHFGCPECFLGLIPGWGGTQLVPRLAGPPAAVRLIVQNAMRQNRLLDGRQAAELGLADRLLEPVEFLDESIAFALELAEAPLVRPEPDWSGLADVIRRARAQLDDAVHGAAPAPYRALELIEGAAS